MTANPTNDSLTTVLKDRRVIPRWKSPKQAVETFVPNERVLLARAAAASPWIAHLTAKHERLQSIYTANELYETAKLFERENELAPEVRELSRPLQVYARAIVPPQEASRLPDKSAPFVTGTVDIHYDTAKCEISRLRRELAIAPGRPFGWSELARHYLVVGQVGPDGKAVRAMATALQLSKRNQYLSRAATRLFVHVGDPERALSLLRANPALRDAPWLLAAEIATSSVVGKESKFITSGRRLIASKTFSEMQISELAAAIGTVELVAGSIKRAKALFNTSLIDPTENSLAQAQWAFERDAKIVIPSNKLPASPEAEAMASRQSGSWDQVLQACTRWLAVEPFSSRPAILGSYLVFDPKHRVAAEEFASAGLRSDKDNFMLLNNRAVARAYLGRTEEALADLRLAVSNKAARADAHLLATFGLIAFRGGMPELGRELYAQSIAWFTQSGSQGSAASAVLHLLREEIRIDPSALAPSREFAKRVLTSPIAMREPELKGMADALLAEVLAAEALPQKPDNRPDELAPWTEEIKAHAALMQVPELARHQAKQFLPDAGRSEGGSLVAPISLVAI